MNSYWWDEPTSVLLPGRPDGVEGLSTNLTTTGNSIATQASRLRGVNADIWKGEAAVKFTEHIKETPGQLDTLATRYKGVASALSTYACDLRSAQAKVTRAKEKAREAAAEQAATTQAVADAQAANAAAERSARQQSADFPDQPPLTPTLAPLGPLQTRAGDAAAAMDEAERLLAEADADRDRSASDCKKTIDGCVDDNLKNQGGFFGWVKHTFKKIAPILSVIAAVAGIAALFIPGLNLIALGLAVLNLAVSAANHFVFDQGSLLNVALDLVGVGAFGAAVKLTRAARAAQSAQAASRAAQSARTGAAINRASSAKSLQGIARTQLNMTRSELRAARAAGTLRETVGARQAAALADASADSARTSRLLADAAHPFRTMLRDHRQLVRTPTQQLAPNQWVQGWNGMLQLSRSGTAGRAATAANLTGTVADVLSAPPLDAPVAGAAESVQHAVAGTPVDVQIAEVGADVQPAAPTAR